MAFIKLPTSQSESYFHKKQSLGCIKGRSPTDMAWLISTLSRPRFSHLLDESLPVKMQHISHRPYIAHHFPRDVVITYNKCDFQKIKYRIYRHFIQIWHKFLSKDLFHQRALSST